MDSPLWTKAEYVKDRTDYYKTEHGLSKRFAEDCAAEDWSLYCERYGYEESKGDISI